MGKTISFILSLLMVLSLFVFPAHDDETKEPAVYGPIGLQMVDRKVSGKPVSRYCITLLCLILY